MQRARLRSRIHKRRSAGLRLRTCDIQVLERHHSAPRYRRGLSAAPSAMGGRGRKREQAEERGKGGKGERPGYGYWRGAFSPAQRPWKERTWSEVQDDRRPKPLFPSYTAMPKGPPPEPARASAIPDITVESETMVEDLQTLLNMARKKENRLARLTSAREKILAQWNEWNRQMREAFIKERTRYLQEDARLQQEIARATEDQQMARHRVRGAFLGETMPTQEIAAPMEVESSAAAWEAARAAWSAEDGVSLSGVLQRCIDAPNTGPPRRLRPEYVDMMNRVDIQAGPPLSGPVDARLGQPTMPPANVSTVPPGLEAPTPAPAPTVAPAEVSTTPLPHHPPQGHARPLGPEPYPKVSPKHPGQRVGPRVPTSEGPPRNDIKAATKVPPQPSTGGTTLQCKLDAKRAHMTGNAMHPFGLSTTTTSAPEAPPTEATAEDAATSAFIADDPDELEETMNSPGFTNLE